MSNTIDNRVVRMEFDNSNFEKNVKVSMDSLEKLDSKIESTSKSGEKFQQIERASEQVTLANMASAIDNIQQRFSALGIAGMTVIQELTEAVLGFVKKIGTETITTVFKGGFERATNIQQAIFQMEGLGHTWEEVAQNVDNAVSGTAYGLDSAAKAASQLIASGVEPAGELMGQALKGISGVAAMTNREYDDISRIFTTIAGNGRVMGMQLTQLAQSGLNVAADLAKELGISEAELRENVSKGLVDFETFARIMSEKYGEHAKDANRTWSGALANIKAAEKKIGERFWTPIMQNDGPLVQYFNSVRNNINAWKDNVFGDLAEGAGKAFAKIISGLATMNDKFRESFFGKGDEESFESLKKKLNNLGITWENFQINVAETAEKHGIDVEALSKKYGDFDKSLNSGWLNGELFSETLLSLSEAQLKSAGYTDEQIVGIKALAAEAKKAGTTLNKFLTDPIKNMTNAQLFKSVLGSIGNDFKSLGRAISGGFSEVFDGAGTKLLRGFLEILYKVTERFKMTEESAQNLQRTFKGFFSLIDIIAQALKIVLIPIGKLLSFIPNFNALILKGTGNLGDLLYNLDNLIKETKIFDRIGNAIADVFQKIADGIKAAIDKFKEFFGITKKVEEPVKTVAKATETAFSKTKDAAIDAVDTVKEKLGDIKDGAKDTAKVVSDSGITNGIKKLGNGIADSSEKGINSFRNLAKESDNASKKIIENSEKVTKSINKQQHPILSGFSNLFSGVKSYGRSFSEWTGEQLTQTGDKLKETTFTIEHFRAILDAIKVGIQAFVGIKFGFAIDRIGGFFAALSGGIRKILDMAPMPTMMQRAGDFMLKLAISMGIIAGAIVAMSSIDAEKLWKSVGVISAIMGIMSVIVALINKYTPVFGKGEKGIKRMGNFATKFIQISQQGTMFIKLAFTMLLLAAAVKVVGSIDVDKIGPATAAVATLIGILLGIILALEKLSGRQVSTKLADGTEEISRTSVSLGKFGVMFISLAVSTYIIASAIRKVGELDADQCVRGVLAVGLILVAFVGLIETIKSVTKKALTQNRLAYYDSFFKNSVKLSFSMLIFTFSVKTLADSVRMLAKLSWEQWAIGVSAMGICLGALVAAQIVIAKFGEINNKTLLAKMADMWLISIALLNMSISVRILGKQPWDAWGRGLIGLGACISVLIGAALILSRFTGNNTSLKSIAIILTISFVMIELSIAIAIIGKLPWDAWGRGLIGLGTCMTCLIGAAIILSRFTGDNTSLKSIAIILTLGFVLVELSVAMVIIGVLPWDKWARGLIGLGACLTMLVSAAAILSAFSKEIKLKNIAGIILFVTAIDMIVPAVMLLSLLNWESLGKALAGLGGILGLFIAFAAISSALSGAALGILAMSAALVAFGIAISSLGYLLATLSAFITLLMGLTSIEAAAITAVFSQLAIGLSDSIAMLISGVVAGIIEGFLGILPQLIKDAIKALVNAFIQGFITMADNIEVIVDAMMRLLIGLIRGIAARIGELVDAVVLLFKEFFAALERHNISAQDLLLKSIETVGLVAAFMVAITKIKLSVGPALIAVGKIAVVLTAILGVIAGLGALSMLIPGLKYAVEEGGELLMEFGRAIGKFIGGIVGGVVEGFANSMPSIADDLSDFIQRLQPFLDGVRKVDEKTKQGASLVLSIIGTLLAFDLVDGISNFFGGEVDLDKISDQANKMVDIVKDFGNKAKEIPEDTVESAKKTADALLAITEAINAMPTEGGLKSLVFGETDVEKFGTVLIPLIDGVIAFGNKALGISDEMTAAAKNAAEVITAIAEACDAIPNSGLSLSTIIFGDNKPDDWAAQIVVLGKGVCEFAAEVSAITPAQTEAAKNACNIISSLAEVTDEIPNSGISLVSLIVGDNKPDDWAAQIVVLGKGLAKFASTVGKITPVEVVSAWNAVAILRYMTALSTEITAANTISNSIFADSNISKLVSNFVDAAKELKKFIETTQDISIKQVVNAYQIILLLERLTHLQIESLNVPLNFNTTISRLATGFRNFCLQMPDAAILSSIISNKDALTTLFDIIGHMGNTLSNIPNFDKLGKSMYDLAAGLYSYVNMMGTVDLSRLSKDANDLQSFFSSLASVEIGWGSLLYYVIKDEDVKNLTNLKHIGKGLKEFCNSMPEKDAFKTVVDTTSEIKTTIDIIANINEKLGGNTIGDLSTIGTGLMQLGYGISAYIESLKTKDISRLNSDVEVIKTFLTTLNDIIFTNYSLLSVLFTTDSDHIHFGAGMTSVTNGLVNYMRNMKSYTDVSRLSTDAPHIQTFLSALGGTAFNPDNPIFSNDFGDKLKNFADGLSYYISETSTKNGDSNMAYRLNSDGVYFKTFFNTLGEVDMSKGLLPYMFGTASNGTNILVIFAWGMKTLGDTLKEISEGDYTNALDNIKGVMDMFANAATINDDVISKASAYITTISEQFGELYDGSIGKFKDTASISNIITTFIGIIGWGLLSTMESWIVPEWNKYVDNGLLGKFRDWGNSKVYESTNEFRKILTAALTSGNDLKTAGISLSDQVLNGFSAKDKNGYDRFELAGYNALAGFLKGLENDYMRWKIIEAADDIGDSTVAATARALDEHSPSRAMYRVGDFAGLGFIYALTARVKDAEAAGKELGNRPIDAIKATLSNLDFNDYMNLNPIIRPELDLSGILSRTDEINSLFNGNISASGAGIQNGENNVGARQINFTQNNYSPKALSRTEIYRQTRNQLSLAKGAL